MKKWYLFPALLLLLVLGNSCKKEFSEETGLIEAEGSLQSDVTGDCLPKTVAGVYEAGVQLDATNYIEVSLDITSPGTYNITTDTLNGMYFSAVGRFTTIGNTTVKLLGFGGPLAEGEDNFEITFGGTSCFVQVITLPEGAGGPASFTLNGAPGTCAMPSVNGVYATGQPLGASNTIRFAVNVTVIGVYNITTAEVNGITFSGTGTLGRLGADSITLTGSGTPAASGPTEFAVPGAPAGAQSCTYSVNVIGPAEFTIDCASSQTFGTYEAGTPLDPNSNQIRLIVDVTVAGAYNISGTINGMRFESIGEFFSPGTGIGIDLLGSGTPLDGGDFDIEITGGTAACTIPITVTEPVTPDWSFVVDGVTYSGISEGATLDNDPASGFSIVGYDGGNTAGDFIFLNLIDVAGGINNNESYLTDVLTPTSNFALFQYESASGSITFEANPTLVPAPKFTIKVTNHDAPARFIEGTFSGAVKDQSGAIRNITNGTFRGNYP